MYVDLTSSQKPDHPKSSEFNRQYVKDDPDGSLKTNSFPVTKKDIYNVLAPREVNNVYKSCDKCTVKSPHLTKDIDIKRHTVGCNKLLFPSSNSEKDPVYKEAKTFMTDYPFEKRSELEMMDLASDCDVSCP